MPTTQKVNSNRGTVVRVAFLIALLLAVYARVWRAGFIWDDEMHLTENPCIIGPLGFADIWTSARAVYYPLVLTTFWLIHQVAGLSPLPYHGLNLGWHILGALLLWRVLSQLKIRAAYLGALLWAIHPVMVQSVAWVTEMKNTQSAAFYLLAISLFLQARDFRRPGLYAISLFAFAAALTSKPSTVILPAVLLLCLWWRKELWLRRERPWILLPFFLLSLLASGWTVWEQKFHSGASGPEWKLDFLQRLVISADAIGFYLGKIVWPDPLIFIYPRWQINLAAWTVWLPLLGLLTGTILLLVSYFRFQRRSVLFAFSYFVTALLPVLAFFDVYFFRYSYVSDHFQYLASMGPLALAGSALGSLEAKNAFAGRILLLGVVALLSYLSFQQTAKFQNVFSLYRGILADNPECWMAEYNLAVSLKKDGAEAMPHYRRALELKPDYVEAAFNLARLQLQQNDGAAALQSYERALQYAPNDAEIHNNYGNALRELGRPADAKAEYETALRLNPRFVDARVNLAILLLQQGRAAEARTELETAQATAPGNADVKATLGNVLMKLGDFAGAAASFAAALERDPSHLQALNSLGWLRATAPEASLRDGGKAIELAERALRLPQSSQALALHTLAAAYAETGDFAQASATANRALAAAEKERKPAIIEAVRDELTLYETGLPYHQPSRRKQ